MITLDVPDTWDVTIHNPRSVAPLSDQEILKKLETPISSPSLTNLCRGKSSPLIIVDDLNRPTPASKIFPYLLSLFQKVNIPYSDVTILIATGTHGPPPADGIRKKVGDKAFSSCKILIHDCFKYVRKIGTTSFGTPVHINEVVLRSDLVIGLGGIYQNHTAGFGGGAKIILGVLGMRSIFQLHNKHQRAGWGADGINGSFRKDLEEIAEMAKLQFAISVQINLQRDIIQIHCGDPRVYFPEAVQFCREVFTVPKPLNADIVISNAYPNDLSLTFVKQKGLSPLKYCNESATRIAIATCHEGVGLHNIYPYVNVPRFFTIRHLARLFLALPFSQVIKKIMRRLGLPLQFFGEEPIIVVSDEDEIAYKNPVWLYRPGLPATDLPANPPGLRITQDWNEIIETIKKEQGEGRKLKVSVYPCAFLQNII